MAVVPYMPLYVADYLGDTSHLSTLEHGAYLLLILSYWQRGRGLPASNERLANVARLSNEEWAIVRPTLSEFFEERDGLWVQKRIEKELSHLHEVSNHNKKGGIASGKARREKAKRLANERSTNVQRTRNQTDADADADADERRVFVVNDLQSSREVLTDERTNASVRLPETQTEKLHDMHSAIHGYMEMQGTPHQRTWKPPDDRIVAKCVAAINGTPMRQVGEFLRDRFLNHEQSPRHKNGPQSYAWFLPVLKEKFGGHK